MKVNKNKGLETGSWSPEKQGHGVLTMTLSDTSQ